MFCVSKNYKRIKNVIEKSLKKHTSFSEQARKVREDYESLEKEEAADRSIETSGDENISKQKFNFEKLLFLLSEVNRIIRLSIIFDQNAKEEIAHLCWLQEELIKEQSKYLNYISSKGLTTLKNSKKQKAVKAHIYYRRAISSSLATISLILSRKSNCPLKTKKIHLPYHQQS